MSRIVDTRNIGSYTLSIYDDGAMIIEAGSLPERMTFNTGQVQELLQWLTQQKNLVQPEISNAPQVPVAVPV